MKKYFVQKGTAMARLCFMLLLLVLSVKPHIVVDVPSPLCPTQICVEVHKNDLKFIRKKTRKYPFSLMTLI